MRTNLNVMNFLQSEAVPHEFFMLDGPAKSADRTAAILGLDLRSVAKTLIFLADEEPVLVMVPGDKWVSSDKLKASLGVSKVVFPQAPVVISLTGFPIGAIPPCGHEHRLSTVMDKKLLSHPVIYASGGTSNMILKIHPKDLQKATNAQVADICRPA